MTPAAPAEHRDTGIEWDFRRLGYRTGAASLAVFSLLYALLVLLGDTLHENVEQLTILWPAAGLLFVALWLAPRRNWIWILLIQLAIELSVSAVHSEQFTLGHYALFALANSLDAMVGASVASRFIMAGAIPKVRNVLLFIGSVAVGAAASAIVGAYGSISCTRGRGLSARMAVMVGRELAGFPVHRAGRDGLGSALTRA